MYKCIKDCYLRVSILLKQEAKGISEWNHAPSITKEHKGHAAIHIWLIESFDVESFDHKRAKDSWNNVFNEIQEEI